MVDACEAGAEFDTHGKRPARVKLVHGIVESAAVLPENSRSSPNCNGNVAIHFFQACIDGKELKPYAKNNCLKKYIGSCWEEALRRPPAHRNRAAKIFG